jgi:hypothetical protein
MTGDPYKLTCWQCSREIEVPAGAPEDPVIIRCPHCETALNCWWRAADDAGLSPDPGGLTDAD